MSDPTNADIAAARRIMGETNEVTTHPQVAKLPGANTCPHRLYGSGEPMDLSVGGATAFKVDALQFWATSPYRHHEFVFKRTTAIAGFDECKCGNYRENSCHQVCVK